MTEKIIEKVAECDSEQEMALRILFHTYRRFYHRLRIIAEMSENQNVKEPLRGMIQSIAEETESDYLLISDEYYQPQFYVSQDAGVDKKEADL